MLSKAWYSTISPEGAASILGRYKDDAHKKDQFPKDAAKLATIQGVYAPQLKECNVIDTVIWEKDDETCTNFPVTLNNIEAFVESSIEELSAISQMDLVEQRYNKFRAMGKFKIYPEEESKQLMSAE